MVIAQECKYLEYKSWNLMGAYCLFGLRFSLKKTKYLEVDQPYKGTLSFKNRDETRWKPRSRNK